jgi:diaminopimelate epimerase
MDFVKLVAAGNDFILVEGGIPVSFSDLPSFAVWACQRQTGIGADGVLLLRRMEAGHVQVTVANPDGSIARMCGNGARCAALYSLLSGAASPLTVSLLGRDQVHSLVAWLTDGVVEMTSPQPKSVSGPVTIAGLDYYALDTGTEYAVAFVPDVDSVDVAELGPMIRHHPYFGSAGTSVTFAQSVAGELMIRTYERGNEAETLSCGSGAVASAVTARHLGMPIGEVVSVRNRGGIPLRVRLSGAGPPFDTLTLSGPAEAVFSGRIGELRG